MIFSSDISIQLNYLLDLRIDKEVVRRRRIKTFMSMCSFIESFWRMNLLKMRESVDRKLKDAGNKGFNVGEQKGFMKTAVH